LQSNHHSQNLPPSVTLHYERVRQESASLAPQSTFARAAGAAAEDEIPGRERRTQRKWIAMPEEMRDMDDSRVSYFEGVHSSPKSDVDPELSQHFASPKTRDAQGSAVELLNHPFFFQRGFQ
jgi:hypothetical protein